VPAPRADAGPGANSSVWMLMAHYRALRGGPTDATIASCRDIAPPPA